VGVFCGGAEWGLLIHPAKASRRGLVSIIGPTSTACCRPQGTFRLVSQQSEVKFVSNAVCTDCGERWLIFADEVCSRCGVPLCATCRGHGGGKFLCKKCSQWIAALLAVPEPETPTAAELATASAIASFKREYGEKTYYNTLAEARALPDLGTFTRDIAVAQALAQFRREYGESSLAIVLRQLREAITVIQETEPAADSDLVESAEMRKQPSSATAQATVPGETVAELTQVLSRSIQETESADAEIRVMREKPPVQDH
jgi:hypothetical protein